ncbi:DUF342 domain-containing protein [Catenovulum sp. SM1970]|uniref:DUF342 domain-containing protein n=1 Tax=Marinifaba aquimaris TaxID=2741323 RepID=UPI001574DFE6|nr:FapA family protein [Marinifaba aquimaris]NTS77688.1 DUF342 domain-containing protein [Marinifaba aquimaris]
MTDIAIQLDEDNKVIVEASFEQASAVDEDQIVALFKQSDCQSFFLNPEWVKDACAQINEKISLGLANQPLKFPIGEKRNAEIKIAISADKMQAKAELTTAYGGAALSAKHILKYASQASVTMGINKANIEALAQKQSGAEPGSQFSEEIANGKLPVNGKDSYFEALTESAKDRLLRPQKTDHGKVDMRDLGELISVKENDELMRRHPPTRGKPGFTVTGDPLHPEPGEKLEFEVGEGSKISPKDDSLLIAAMPGLPSVLERGMKVDNVLLLPGIDVSSGHIDFEGGVVVTGDVGEGMRLKATGDVTITGFIDNAQVEVAGDLTVAGGIVGRKLADDANFETEPMHCSVKATGTIAAKYAQYAELIAGRDIEVISQIIHCRATAKRVFGGQIDKPAAKLVGGHFYVQQQVSFATIGSPASTHTYIHLFEQYRHQLEQITEAQKRIKHEEEKIIAIKQSWQKVKRLPDSAKKKALIEKTQMVYKTHHTILKRLQKAQQRLEQSITENTQNMQITAVKDMYSNVHMEFDGQRINTERDYPPIKVVYKDEKLAKISL